MRNAGEANGLVGADAELALWLIPGHPRPLRPSLLSWNYFLDINYVNVGIHIYCTGFVLIASHIKVTFGPLF